MSTNVAQQIVATDAALTALRNLRGAFGSLILFQSGARCEAGSPICLAEGELDLGPSDLLVGEVAGVPFYIDGEQYERWNRPQLVLDVGRGPAEGFSLEGLAGIHFVLAGSPCSAQPSSASS